MENRVNMLDWIKLINKPLVILPQSWNSIETVPATSVYVREQQCLTFEPAGILAPDLALGYELETRDLAAIHQFQPQFNIGHFFREDIEKLNQPMKHNLGDPALMTKSWTEYLQLASRFKHLHTNRLHFAIARLLAGRKVTLYDNSYGKNKAMFNTWLHEIHNISLQDEPVYQSFIHEQLYLCFSFTF